MSQYLDKDGASRIAENFLSKQAEQDAILRNLQFDLKEAEHALVKTIQGPAPLNIRALTRPLDDYLVSGNTVQDGTPTQDAPVYAVGCGVKTGNLVDGVLTDGYFLDTDFRVSASGTVYQSIRLHLESGNYTFSFEHPVRIVRAIVDNTYYENVAENVTEYTITITDDNYDMGISFRDERTSTLWDNSPIMLNLGSESLPYEPYGYKLPITIGGTEYPIYLGQVDSTRRIKKLVLTGEEDWTKPYELKVFRINVPDYLREMVNIPICTHYKGMAPVGGTGDLEDLETAFLISSSGINYYYIRDDRFNDANDFKSYLTAQYVTGTPVTIWYVLAEPETGIVNEPLHKIGNYADTISMAQSGVEISTTKGFNTITTDTTVLPSNIEVKGVINNA